MQQVVGGRYRIERPVGRGGLTDVYEATDLTLQRRVALKALHRELDEEPAVRHLFEEAARRGASLAHPNIVSVLDYGNDNGITYVVAEWMNEPTLAAILANGPVEPQRVAQIGADVAAALADAHAHGILHWGMKPSDVFVAPDGEAKVSGFGVTRAAERARSLDREARMAEATYVTPERAQGRPAEARTDLYGLGLVLYEAATGRPAAMGSSPAEIASQHLEEYPPKPREVNPAVPAELEAVLARLLAKNPDARLPSAEVVLHELQGLLDSGVLADAAAMAGAPAPLPPRRQADAEYNEEFYEPEEPIAAAAAAVAASAGSEGPVVRIGGTNDSTTILAAPPSYRYRGRRRRPPLVLWAGLAALVLIIIIIALALSGGGGGTKTATVPDVVGKTQDEAVAVLSGLGFKTNLVSLPNDTVAAGVVYHQDPAASRKLAKGSIISLSVSSGPLETTTTTSSTVAPPTVVTRRTTPTTRRITTTVRTVPRTAPPTTRATVPPTAPPTTVTTTVGPPAT